MNPVCSVLLLICDRHVAFAIAGHAPLSLNRLNYPDGSSHNSKKSGGGSTMTIMVVIVVLLVAAVLIALAYRKREAIYDHFPQVECSRRDACSSVSGGTDVLA